MNHSDETQWPDPAEASGPVVLTSNRKVDVPLTTAAALLAFMSSAEYGYSGLVMDAPLAAPLLALAVLKYIRPERLAIDREGITVRAPLRAIIKLRWDEVDEIYGEKRNTNSQGWHFYPAWHLNLNGGSGEVAALVLSRSAFSKMWASGRLLHTGTIRISGFYHPSSRKRAEGVAEYLERWRQSAAAS